MPRVGQKNKAVKRNNYLFFIAIDKYQKVARLNNCVRDARDVLSVLLQKYDFKKERLVALFDEEATRANIIWHLQYFAEKLTENDNLLIYFAGHGYYNQTTNTGYLVPVDKGDYWDYISHNDFLNYVAFIKTFHTFLLIDSCFSGSLFKYRNLADRRPEDTQKFAERVEGFPSRWGLAAGRIEILADGLSGSNSPFARAVLTYLKHAPSPYFPVSDLVQHVKKAVVHNAMQTPVGGPLFGTGDQNGEFVFRMKKGGTIETGNQWEELLDTTDRTVEPPLSPPSPSTYTEKVKGLSFEMVFVKGGKFTMGCTKEQGSDCYGNEKPAHEVELSDYYIGKHPVTQKLWKAVMGSNPSYFKGCDDCPVEQVSWKDAQKFIRKLNELTGKNYRLPTEAEWEYAARGGEKSKGYKYAGGTRITDVAWYGGNSGGKTHPVGKKKPNELGIYDMSGNVWEWCHDWYGGSEYYEECEGKGVVRNPIGPVKGSVRVNRGGSWYGSAGDCRVSGRIGWYPAGRGNVLGFRLARSS